MPVRVVTDSTSDLTPRLANDLGISVVPLSVIFGTESFKEGVQIGHDLFYDRLIRGKIHPSTSAPSVGDFLEVYKPLIDGKHDIISIHLSSKLSATYNNACQAAQQLADAGAGITVIDSLSVSFGLTFLSAAAARAAKEGAQVSDIVATVQSMIPRIRILVTLDTLEYVRRGGRIGRARAFLGAMLRVKPILSIRDGELHPEERVRTRRAALDRMLQIATSYRVKEAAVGYTTSPQDAEEMKTRLAAELKGVPVAVARLGPVIGVHGGPGVLGIGVLEGED